MKRRDFIRNTAFATASIISMPAWTKGQHYQLVTIRGGSPKGMLDLGLDALGGLSRFIQEGQKVLIKPTLRWDSTPEQAANTNPELLAYMVKLCYKARCRSVYLFDQTVDTWTKAYKSSGIERAVKDASAKILPGNRESFYQEVEIPNGKHLKTAKLHQLVSEMDVIINMPVLKVYDGQQIDGALNNLRSLMWNSADCDDECLFDIIQYKKPVLNVIDANRVITKNAPKGLSADDVKNFRTLILSPDIVAADSYAAQRVGIDPTQVEIIRKANEAGLGKITLAESNIKSIILKQQRVSD